MGHCESKVRRRRLMQPNKLMSDCEIYFTLIRNSVCGTRCEILRAQSSQYSYGLHLGSINNMECFWQKPLETMTNANANHTYGHYTYGSAKNTLQPLCRFMEAPTVPEFGVVESDIHKFDPLPSTSKLEKQEKSKLQRIS